ncbi:MAG: S-layer homology domain-containing protein [Clostridiales bacterium]|nr:S-layer homology domain-containing protein [Clostridiales bacterium]
MKKVLSFALVLALILGSFSMVFAADFADVKATDEFSEAVNVLTGLDIVAGYPDGKFKPGQAVTRAEMAALIINALGLPVQGKALTRFSDVPYEHWASGYISYASSLNIINGYPDGTFKPDRTVSYNEALAMIVNALGYTPESLVGSWPGAYVNKARGLGLLDTCKKTGDVGADRGDIVCFLYDALDCYIGKTNKDGEFVPAVPADTFAGRNGAAPYKPAVLGAKAGDPFVVKGNEDAFINMKDYLGAYVTATAKDGKIIAINEVASEFVVGKLDIGKATLGKYKLDPGINATTAPAKDVETFNNGAYVAQVKLNTLDGLTRTWAVKVSGNYVKDIYSASTWALGAAHGVVAAKNLDEIKAKTPKFFGEKFPVDDNDAIDASQFALLGVNSLDAIAVGQVAYVYTDAAGFITRIEIGTETVTGEVTKVSSDKSVATIGGVDYEFAVNATADGKKAQDPGTKGTFRLDYAGDIYDGVIDKEEVVTNYAMVLLVANPPDPEGIDTDKRSVKLLLADGTTKTFSATKAQMDGIGFDGGGVVPYVFPHKAAAPTPVVYKLNEDGKLTDIQLLTAAAPAGPGMTDSGAIGAAETVTAAGLFKGKIVSDKTFIVTFKATGAVWDDAKTYTIVKRADILEKKGEDDSRYYFKAATATNIEVLLFESDGLVEVTKTYGKVLDYDRLAGGKSTVYALADGKEVSYPSEVDYGTLDLEMDKVLVELVVKNGKFTGSNAFGEKFAFNMTTAAASSVDGNFFIWGGNVYTMAADVVVYVGKNDGTGWKVGTTADLDKLEAGTVKLYDAANDGVYEIMVLEK